MEDLLRLVAGAGQAPKDATLYDAGGLIQELYNIGPDYVFLFSDANDSALPILF